MCAQAQRGANPSLTRGHQREAGSIQPADPWWVGKVQGHSSAGAQLLGIFHPTRISAGHPDYSPRDSLEARVWTGGPRPQSLRDLLAAGPGTSELCTLGSETWLGREGQGLSRGPEKSGEGSLPLPCQSSLLDWGQGVKAAE